MKNEEKSKNKIKIDAKIMAMDTNSMRAIEVEYFNLVK